MFYLVVGIIELLAMLGLTFIHEGMIANISGMVLFVTLIMIPLANFMAISRSKGTPIVKVLCGFASVAFTLLVLLGLYNKVSIPNIGLKAMMAGVGITSIIIYIDQKMHPGKRHVSEERQDTLY